VQDYLAAGTSLIWLVYPSTQTVTEYTTGGQVRHLTPDDELNGRDVIPGFRYSLNRLFR
jgi:Uma2 family endonuclease